MTGGLHCGQLVVTNVNIGKGSNTWLKVKYM